MLVHAVYTCQAILGFFCAFAHMVHFLANFLALSGLSAMSETCREEEDWIMRHHRLGVNARAMFASASRTICANHCMHMVEVVSKRDRIAEASAIHRGVFLLCEITLMAALTEPVS